MVEIKQVKTINDMEHIVNMTEENSPEYSARERIRSDIKFDGYIYYITSIDETPCGYYAICPQDFDMCIVIKKICIKKEYADKNIEEAFINYISKKYKNGNYQTIILYTGENDNIDISVYERLGFVCVNRMETEDSKMACKIL